MAKRPQKKEPELNVTSFCDIITVSIVALFMVMVIVIDIALRTPKVRPTPLAIETTNMPVYVECRNNQLYFIDRVEIMQALRSAQEAARRRALSGQTNTLADALSEDIGNTYYRLDNSFIMLGVTALIPRPGVPGIAPPNEEEPNGDFDQLLKTFSTNLHYMVYLVRDDSFETFRKARDLGAQHGFLTGWEYIGRDEPLTFDGMLSKVKAE
ncbi:MAG: hypothetical protein M9963_12365 [Kiritimatiellae bacterium]|nr:hypothetical protein [Kiritimatiellia bacterium]MCO5062766.1 hypothetical protein [Kiritimatiellia bacterium]MCO6399636.1 hypothetical protein [Verrucomicrobiota bacterium]